MPTISPELLNTAYHEAGHAVAPIGLRLGVQWVTVVPDGYPPVGRLYSASAVLSRSRGRRRASRSPR